MTRVWARVKPRVIHLRAFVVLRLPDQRDQLFAFEGFEGRRHVQSALLAGSGHPGFQDQQHRAGTVGPGNPADRVCEGVLSVLIVNVLWSEYQNTLVRGGHHQRCDEPVPLHSEAGVMSGFGNQ